jgi:NDP-sugar pyrophosphorylase family protein
MHGLILAGGEGRRLAADGVSVPKALMPIGGRPQLHRLVETFDALRCESLTCMVRDDLPVERITGAVTNLARVIPCHTPSSLHTLALAFAATPAGPVFCTMVDTVMPWTDWVRAWTACAGALAQGAPAVLVVAPVPPNDPQPLCVRTDAAGHVTELHGNRRDAEWATAGVYGFGRAARARAAQAVTEGVMRMRGFLTTLVREGALIPLVTVDRALDVDRREDLDAANAWVTALDATTPNRENRA